MKTRKAKQLKDLKKFELKKTKQRKLKGGTITEELVIT